MFDSSFVESIKALAVEATLPPAHEINFDELADGTFIYKSNPSGEEGSGAREIGDIIAPPQPDTLTVKTLTALRDLILATKPEPKVYGIHVETETTVALKALSPDRYGRRACLAKAVYTPLDCFTFGEHISDPQKFIIGVQIAFLQTDESQNLIKLVSALKAGASVATEDDGFSQRVTVKTGEVSTADIKVPPRMKLIPIRTFAEASPVQSEFLIRFKVGQQGQAMPALFDLEGNKWKGEAMQSIKTALTSLLGDEGKDYFILA